MKHITRIFAALFLIFALCACGSETEEKPTGLDSRVVGTWVLSSHYSDGYSEKDYLYVFHSDGSMDFFGGDVWTRHYADCKTADGKLTMTIRDVGLSQEYTLLVESGTMRLVSDSGTLKFVQISGSVDMTAEQIAAAY